MSLLYIYAYICIDVYTYVIKHMYINCNEQTNETKTFTQETKERDKKKNTQ